METLSTAKDLRSQKLEQVKRARSASQSKKKVIMSRKRKLAVTTVDDEAISPASNRHVQSLCRKTVVTTTPSRAISKKVVEKAVSISRAVARKNYEQAMYSEHVTVNPENVMHACNPENSRRTFGKQPHGDLIEILSWRTDVQKIGFNARLLQFQSCLRCQKAEQ